LVDDMMMDDDDDDDDDDDVIKFDDICGSDYLQADSVRPSYPSLSPLQLTIEIEHTNSSR